MSAESTVFVDTNILVYAYDVDAGEKHRVARDLMGLLWESRRGRLSTQVLQEFYVTVTRKLAAPLDPSSARRVIAAYRAWPIQAVDITAILAAGEIAERYQLSFWDALILVAAQKAGAQRVLSEDLRTGGTIAGLLIENPFAV